MKQLDLNLIKEALEDALNYYGMECNCMGEECGRTCTYATLNKALDNVNEVLDAENK